MDLQQFLCGLPPDRLIGINLNLCMPKTVRRLRSTVGRGVGRLRDRTMSTVTNTVSSVHTTVGTVTTRAASIANRPTYRRHLPVGSGKHTVGCVDIMSDLKVSGTFMRLYYPTAKTDIFQRDSQWPLWLPRKLYGLGYVYFRRKNTKIYGTLLNWLGGDVYVPCLWQAPILDDGTKFPVLLFTHGLGGNRTTNTSVCCDIASHGFIVCAIEHRDGSASMTYCYKNPESYYGNNNDEDSSEESGEENEGMEQESLLVDNDEYYDYLEHAINNQERWLWYERQKDELSYELRNKQIYTRVKELSRLLNLLESINAGKELRNVLGLQFDMRQLKGMMDLDRVAVSGHSFGGATTVAALAFEKRIKCGVALDSWMLPLDDHIYNTVCSHDRPLLFVNSDTFQWKDNVTDMLKCGVNKDGQDQRLLLTVRGTCHQTCTDFQFIVPSRVARILDMRDSLDSYAAMDLNNKANVGFLCKHLDIPDRDIPTDILSGKHPLVVLGTTVDMTVEDGSCPHTE